MVTRFSRPIGYALVGTGLLGLVGGLALVVAAWHTAWSHEASGEAARDREQVAASETRIQWTEGAAASIGPGGAALASSVPDPAELRNSPDAIDAASTSTGPVDGEPRLVALAPADLLGVANVELRYLDPPRPGARATLSLSISNRSDAASGALRLLVARKWFEQYGVIGAIPPVLDDRQLDDRWRAFDFPSLAPGEERVLSLVVSELDEDISTPSIQLQRLSHASGKQPDSLTEAEPSVSAPRPEPGPARAVEIPKLGLRASVVPTAWEPPSFVVGQLRGTANVSEGNTVLIGHLRGLSGNVFDRLDRLALRDEVVAVSRGLEYRFVVSEMVVLANNDVSPLAQGDQPRLTLMTCTGTWNPITQDYSHRLWVIAEPPEQAEATIKANAERPTPTPAGEPVLAEPAPALEAPASPQLAVPAVGQPLEQTVPSPTVPGALPTPALAMAPATAPPPLPFPAPRRARLAGATPAPPVAGLSVGSPRAGTAVAPRFTLRGKRALPTDPQVHVWLFARAELQPGHWFVLPREIAADRSGNWEAEVELGGQAGLRHELKVGAVDEATHLALLHLIQEQPGQPLAALPDGFWDEVSLVLTRR
jgi:sortase (surface protein transpeptidase)